jgi:hypothetical protein
VCESNHSKWGHVAISGLIVVFLAVIATANIPGNGVRKTVGKVDDPALAAIGARQVWSVFAPDPAEVVSELSVRFSYGDGSNSTWRIRRGGALVHGYRDYRWLKLAENAARSDVAAQGLLLWAARNKAQPKPIARVDLIRTVYDIAPPGKPRSQHGPVDRGVILSLRAGG